MREVAADATVLIFLAKLDRLDAIRERYDHVVIPEAVFDEVVTRGRELGAVDAVVVDEAVDAGWIEVMEAKDHRDIDRFDLEMGETYVLSTALDRDHDDVLVDEESVREVARLLDLRPRGTVFFLLDALRRGEFGFEGFVEALERLLESGFYLHESVYLEAIRIARRLAD